MKTFLYRLRDKKGSAMVFGIVLFIVLLMLSCALFTYSELKIRTAYLRNTAQRVLDTCTVTEGRREIESFKNGSDYTPALDSDIFKKRLQDALGTQNSLTGYQNGKEKFKISDVALTFTEHEIKTTVQFKIHEPLYLFGKEVTALDIPVTLYSKFNSK